MEQGQLLWLEAGRKKARLTVFNSSSWNRSDLLEIAGGDVPLGSVWTDQDGQVLQSQYANGRWIVEAANVPALGMAAIHYAEGCCRSW